MHAGGQKIAYFRGRKLHGKALKVPEGYRGVVVEKKEAPTSQTPSIERPEEVVDVDAEKSDLDVPLGALETQADFAEMVIWGHESIAEASSDPYVRGVDEWIKLAEQVCATEENYTHASFRGVCLWLKIVADAFI